jgi:DNA-binding NtrC family response regulator
MADQDPDEKCLRLEAACLQMEEVAGKLTHDLRGHLQIITGYVALLEENSHERIEPYQLECIAGIKAAAKNVQLSVDGCPTPVHARNLISDGTECSPQLSLVPFRQSAFVDEQVYDLVVIDDDPRSIQLVKHVLARERFRVQSASNETEGLELIVKCRPRVVLLDLLMPGVKGMELLDRILAIDPGIDVILITGHYSTESAVEAIQKGAYDYWTKPLDVSRLRERLAKWIAEAEMRQRTNRLDTELLEGFQFEGVVGRSPRMLEVFSKIRRAAPHFQTVLVTGETGTGKESVAKALHQLSPYASGPFVVCNCAAIPESLFESELFGHVRGAFSGATHDKEGFAESASGGTLFLDEVTEIPVGSQAKLLRLLQNREIQRVGASRSKGIDVRIVASTNLEPRDLVMGGKLREDLFYRLSMIEIKLPRLADRREDLPLLQRHFLDQFSRLYSKPTLNLTRRAQAVIAGYAWPGNIRELENALGYCCMMAARSTIDIVDFPEYLQPCALPEQHEDEMLLSMQTMEIRHMQRVLENVGGDRERAAEILKIGRSTLYRLLKRVNDVRGVEHGIPRRRKPGTEQKNSLTSGVA